MPLALQFGLVFVLGLLGGFILGERSARQVPMLPLGLPSSLDGNHGPLSFLEDCEPEEVAKVLGEEPYPDAAGVLGVLNPGFADIVLQLMDPKLQETLINLLQHQRAMSASKQTRMAEVLRPKFRILG